MSAIDNTIFFYSVLLYSLNVVEGRYVLQVRLQGYDNPTQECAFCDTVCCDRRNSMPCTENSRCDTSFYYCLRAHGSSGDGCSYNGSVQSNRNRNDANISFNTTRVLGLDNPLSLEGLTDSWNGVQLYVEARDLDFNGGYELIDVFEIDHNLMVGDESQQIFTGEYDIMELELTLTTFCEPGYTGTKCDTNIDDCSEDSCNGNGDCEDGVNTFTCVCYTGFTGRNCDININDCLGVNCSGNGECTDGIRLYTCDCYSGYTGEICDENIDDCVGRNCSGHGRCDDGVATSSCLCDSGYTGSDCKVDIDECIAINCSGHGQCVDGIDSFSCDCNTGYKGNLCEIMCMTVPCGQELQASTRTGPIVGGVLGVCLSLIIILILGLVVVFIMRCRNRRRKIGSSSGNGHRRALPSEDNHIYSNGITDFTHVGLPITSVGHHYSNELTNQDGDESVDEREFNNPIYGDNCTENVYTDPNSHKMEVSSLADHEFDNPIYGDEMDVNTHSTADSTTVINEGVMTTKGHENVNGRQTVTRDTEQDYDYIDQ